MALHRPYIRQEVREIEAHYVLLTDSKIGRREIRVDLWLPQTVDFDRALESKVDAILVKKTGDTIRCRISMNRNDIGQYFLQDFPWYRIRIDNASVEAKTWEDVVDEENLPLKLCSVGHEIFDDAMGEVLMQNGEFADGVSEHHRGKGNNTHRKEIGISRKAAPPHG